MRFDKFSFGSIQIDGSTYEHDVIIDRGEIRMRKKKPSKKFREQFSHTPLSMRRGNPLAMPPTHHRQWCIRSIARHAGSTARSRASQDQIACLAHHRRNRGVEARTQRHERDSSRHVLMLRLPAFVAPFLL
jgi:hypothetical protein